MSDCRSDSIFIQFVSIAVYVKRNFISLKLFPGIFFQCMRMFRRCFVTTDSIKSVKSSLLDEIGLTSAKKSDE